MDEALPERPGRDPAIWSQITAHRTAGKLIRPEFDPRRGGWRLYFFFRGARKSRVVAAGLGFSAFGLRISRLLFF
jgi:hypothetical protein